MALSKRLYPLLGPGQPSTTRPDMTEKSLTGSLRSKQAKKRPCTLKGEKLLNNLFLSL